VLKDGKQVTEFREGILAVGPCSSPAALVFPTNNDAGARPRRPCSSSSGCGSEVGGKKLSLGSIQNRGHPAACRPFRPFRPPPNTIGPRETPTGLYSRNSTDQSGQMDRLEHRRHFELFAAMRKKVAIVMAKLWQFPPAIPR